MTTNMTSAIQHQIFVGCNESSLKTTLTKVLDEGELAIYEFSVQNDTPVFPQPISLKWRFPSMNVKGIWKPTADFNKRIKADWELNPMESRISIDAPVIGLFGNDDSNVMTFSCSNAINKVEMDARLREEDDHFYCDITFFSESEQPITDFKVQLRIDSRPVHFSDSLKAVSQWWETFENLKPAHVPAIAKTPLYSTWYQFHQNLNEQVLVEECKLASAMGYKALIIDDGWQTKDNNRGYDFTGDWQPDRIPQMAEFVERVHQTGMKVGIWYSVPFCGKKSKAYKRFKGKFLTEDHRWAPVFDPRYPEVRAHLINLFANAVKDWNLDGFKLDFIDDFHLYPDTPVEQHDGMDYGSINEAVDRLLTDATNALREINPEVFIEFRQKYIGPAMRKYGNMLRAFDCPGDGVMNRVRIADLRMMSGDTAVHSDMVTWHKDETAEVAALQLINTLFGVPQLSIMLHEAPAEHLEMISFYTRYWNDNADVLMQGEFLPSKPLANYPTQKVSKNGTTIIGVYDAYVTTLDNADDCIHIHNGQLANEIVIKNRVDFGTYHCIVQDCKGTIFSDKKIGFSRGLLEISIPPCGILIAKKV